MQCIEAHLIDTSEIFIDGTHIKAHANNKKYESKEMTEDTLFYVKSLQKEVEIDREKQLKKPLKRKEESETNTKVKKISKNDADSVIKENINKSLRMPHKWHVIKMDGF